MVKIICFIGNLILLCICAAMLYQFIRNKETKFSCFMAGYMLLMAIVSSVAEQLAYIQRVGGSTPSVPIDDM